MNIQTRTMEREAIEALERDPEPEPPAEMVQEWWNALDRRMVTRWQSFAPPKHHNGRKTKRDPRRIPKRAA